MQLNANNQPSDWRWMGHVERMAERSHSLHSINDQLRRLPMDAQPLRALGLWGASKPDELFRQSD